jgi:hypothetical protein
VNGARAGMCADRTPRRAGTFEFDRAFLYDHFTPRQEGFVKAHCLTNVQRRNSSNFLVTPF